MSGSGGKDVKGGKATKEKLQTVMREPKKRGRAKTGKIYSILK